MSPQNLPLIVGTVVGAAIQLAAILVAINVMPAAGGGPNLPVLLGGIGVGTAVEMVGLVLTLKARSR